MTKFLMEAKFRDPQPFLQFLDWWNLRRKHHNFETPNSISSLIRFAPVTAKVLEHPIEWTPLSAAHAAEFSNILTRLTDFYLMASMKPTEWAQVASDEGCTGDSSKLDAIYGATVQLRGEDAGYRRVLVEAIAGLETFQRTDGATLLVIQANSLMEAANTAAYLVFWRILALAPELFCCRQCKSAFISVGGRLDCSNVCARLVSSKIAKTNSRHRRNRVRIELMIGALLCWRMRPFGHWQDVVSIAWHEPRTGSSSSKNNLHARTTVRRGNRPSLLQLTKNATYEDKPSGPIEFDLLYRCSPVQASLTGEAVAKSNELMVFRPTVRRLYGLIRQCDETQLNLDTKARKISQEARAAGALSIN
jgi:hypothetical protein